MMQEKIYNLHSLLQDWAKKLPMRLQQRLSCELLANLAQYLLQDPTIFEIVNSLLDIQHFVEKDLFHKRLELKNKFIAEQETLSKQNLVPEEFEKQKKTLTLKHRKELRKHDIGIIQILDEKVAEQQDILEKAGLPSFRVTSDPIEIQVQMCLLDFIIRSGKTIYQL